MTYSSQLYLTKFCLKL